MGIPQAYVDGAQSAKLQPDRTEATRYLCAAAHLDERFARAVLDEVLYQPHRAVAPSHGISLGPVLRHALAARRRSLIRDGIVAGVLALGFVVSFSVGLMVVISLLSLWLAVHLLRSFVVRRSTRAIIYVIAAIILIPLLLMLIGGSYSLLSYWFYGLSYSGFPEAGGVLGRGAVWLLLLLVIWGTYFVYRLIVHNTIAAELTPEFYDPRRAPAVGPIYEQHLNYIEQAQQGNLTIYSQETGARAFIGFGPVVEEWSLVTPLRPAVPSKIPAPLADDDSTTIRRASPQVTSAIPFTIDELYEAIRTGMATLRDPRLPPDEVVPHLSVRDRVFLAGRLPFNSPFLDRGYPRYRVSEAEIQEVQQTPRGRLRHYQSVRMVAWDGEVEVTTFVHTSRRGGMLFVEFVATAMPGILPAYHRIDTYDRLDAAAIFGALGRAIGDVIRSPLAVVALAGAVIDRIRRALNESSESHRISRQLMFDYGCRSSVRELAADFLTPMRFQLYDADERMRVVGRRLLQVLVDFLSDRHYDVRDLDAQATTVINDNSTRIKSTTLYNPTINRTKVSKSTLNNSPVVAGNSASTTVNSGPQSTASSPAQ